MSLQRFPCVYVEYIYVILGEIEANLYNTQSKHYVSLEYQC